MLCRRCGGLLIIDDFMDLFQGRSRIRSQGYRCVNCGCIEDAIIQANRRHGISAEHHGVGDPCSDGRMNFVESISGGEGNQDERRDDLPECES